MLGFSTGYPTVKSKFGRVNSTFRMDDVKCTGNEDSLLDCQHNTEDNCGDSEGAGVICDRGSVFHCHSGDVKKNQNCFFSLNTSIHHICHTYHIRRKCKFNSLTFAEVELVGGSGPHEGNILVGGLPVCDDGHDAQNALVVCRFDQTQMQKLLFILAN